jgi:predicted AAA+ superfamily ATPase
MYISRTTEKHLLNRLINKKKISVIYGARQTGKTTISNQIIELSNLKTLSINSDLYDYFDYFEKPNLQDLKGLLSGYELLYIDEAQEFPNIGKILKIIYDEFKEIKVLVTGSSSFSLSSAISEPLTGRKTEYILFPFSIQEIKQKKNIAELKGTVKKILIYGSYPDVFLEDNFTDKQESLLEVTRSYLYKDLLALASIKYPHKLKQITKLLAYQIGSPVSVNELAKNTSLSSETVERYLDLLEKSFVIFRLSSFTSNMRKTIRKQDKFYFYDLGVRNAIIENFKDIEQRNDKGQLWENFVILEMRKKINNNRELASQYFWRTYDGAEIDLIEQRQEKIYAYEIKYNKIKKNPPKSWSDNFKDYSFDTITINNFHKFF